MSLVSRSDHIACLSGFRLSAMLTLFTFLFVTSIASAEEAHVAAFKHAVVHFEQNVTDEDVEVVFEIKGNNEGLVKLSVVSPTGHTVLDFMVPDANTTGIRQFVFESPEPKDIASLKQAYPEGKYTFSGTTASGIRLYGESELSHQLPQVVTLISPATESESVPISGLTINWTPVGDVTAYILEIEQDELDVKVIARLSGQVTKFTVPDGFLLHDTEYDLSIGTITDTGNASFIETSFTTEGKE